MKSKINGFLFTINLCIFFISCSENRLVIYIDELSINFQKEIIEHYQKKYPERTLELYVYNTDFIFQSIKMGKLPKVMVSFDTSYAKKFQIHLPKKKLLQRDALVLAIQDSQIFSINDLLTKGKYIALPMHNTAIQNFTSNYLNYHKIHKDYIYPVYPHDFQSMKLLLEKKMVSAGLMLKSQADYYKIRNLYPFFHQSYIHYIVEFEEKK